MAATIFEIIAVVAIVVAVLVAVLVLPLLAGLLKSFNKSGVKRAREFRTQVTGSLEDVDAVQAQLDALGQVTRGVKAGMDSAVEAAGKAVSFLESRTFQVGLPAVLWLLLLAVAVPRGIRGLSSVKPRRVIPPPSWEESGESSAD